MPCSLMRRGYPVRGGRARVIPLYADHGDDLRAADDCRHFRLGWFGPGHRGRISTARRSARRPPDQHRVAELVPDVTLAPSRRHARAEKLFRRERLRERVVDVPASCIPVKSASTARRRCAPSMRSSVSRCARGRGPSSHAPQREPRPLEGPRRRSCPRRLPGHRPSRRVAGGGGLGRGCRIAREGQQPRRGAASPVDESPAACVSEAKRDPAARAARGAELPRERAAGGWHLRAPGARRERRLHVPELERPRDVRVLHRPPVPVERRPEASARSSRRRDRRGAATRDDALDRRATARREDERVARRGHAGGGRGDPRCACASPPRRRARRATRRRAKSRSRASTGSPRRRLAAERRGQRRRVVHHEQIARAKRTRRDSPHARVAEVVRAADRRRASRSSRGAARGQVAGLTTPSQASTRAPFGSVSGCSMSVDDPRGDDQRDRPVSPGLLRASASACIRVFISPGSTLTKAHARYLRAPRPTSG